MFKDYATIRTSAGKGGDGAISFHKEKFIDKGGPDGGDGGDGGSIYFYVDQNCDSLHKYVEKKKFVANDGKNGARARCTGAKGDDLLLPVPPGTILYEITNQNKKEFCYDFCKETDKYLAAKGGDGGFGNAHFVSSVRQIPRFRELGEPGQTKKYILELKTIADIGLVGLPNAGKSTFLSVITKAKPKIADYPFTTLSPNLGTLSYKNKYLTIADIPGLIAGAHQGKGLGYDFLKHIERTRIILHMIDINSIDPVNDYKTINSELKKFNPNLISKPQIICLTKFDQLGWNENSKDLLDYIHEFKKSIRYRGKVFVISSVTHSGLDKLKDYLINKKANLPKSENYTQEKLIEKTDQNFVEITKKNNQFFVAGKKIEKFINKTDFDNTESVQRIRDILHKTGIDQLLKKKRIKPGDKIIINNKEFNW